MKRFIPIAIVILYVVSPAPAFAGPFRADLWYEASGVFFPSEVVSQGSGMPLDLKCHADFIVYSSCEFLVTMKVEVNFSSGGLYSWAQDLVGDPPTRDLLDVAPSQYSPSSPFTPGGNPMTNVGLNLLLDWGGDAFSPVSSGTYDLMQFNLRFHPFPGFTDVVNIFSPVGSAGWSATTDFDLNIADNTPIHIGLGNELPAIQVALIPEPATILLLAAAVCRRSRRPRRVARRLR